MFNAHFFCVSDVWRRYTFDAKTKAEAKSAVRKRPKLLRLISAIASQLKILSAFHFPVESKHEMKRVDPRYQIFWNRGYAKIFLPMRMWKVM